MRRHPCLRSFPVSMLRLTCRRLEKSRPQERGSHLRPEQTTLPGRLSSLQLMCPPLETVAAHSRGALEIPQPPRWEVALDFAEVPTHPLGLPFAMQPADLLPAVARL